MPRCDKKYDFNSVAVSLTHVNCQNMTISTINIDCPKLFINLPTKHLLQKSTKISEENDKIIDFFDEFVLFYMAIRVLLMLD